MPRINARYAAGPLGEAIYRAAEAAGMPTLVISGYDGTGFTWRWRTSGSDSAELREVVLHIRPSSVGGFGVEVGVEDSSHSLIPRPSKWRLVGQTRVPGVAALDESWLADQLRTALTLREAA